MINPNNPIYWDTALKAVHPQFGDMLCKVNNKSGNPIVWGYSVWKRQGGYRTYGLSVDVMLERGWVFYEVDAK